MWVLIIKITLTGRTEQEGTIYFSALNAAKRQASKLKKLHATKAKALPNTIHPTLEFFIYEVNTDKSLI